MDEIPIPVNLILSFTIVMQLLMEEPQFLSISLVCFLTPYPPQPGFLFYSVSDLPDLVRSCKL